MEKKEKKWFEIYFKNDNIKYKNEKSVLLEADKGKFKGYLFWYPLKLLKPVNNFYSASLVTTAEFQIKIFKNKKNSREISSEKIITGEDLKIFFPNQDSEFKSAWFNISERVIKSIEIRRAKKIDVKEVNVPDEFIDD